MIMKALIIIVSLAVIGYIIYKAAKSKKPQSGNKGGGGEQAKHRME